MNKNNLGRLNDILFEQLDRMNNTDLKGQELQDEIDRADAIIDIGRTIIQKRFRTRNTGQISRSRS